MEKRFLLAFALSFLILLGYPYLLTRFYGPSPKQVAARLTSTEAQIGLTQEIQIQQDEEKEAPSLVIENDKISWKLDAADGSIREVFLKAFKNHASGGPLNIIKVGDKADSLGKVLFENPTLHNLKYELVERNAHLLKYSESLPEGIVVTRQIELSDDSYLYHLTLTFENHTTQTLPLYYSLLCASNLQKEEKNDRYFELLSSLDGKKKRFHLNQVQKSPVTIEQNASWVALKARYFSILFKPEEALSKLSISSTKDHDNMVAKVWSLPQSIPPGGTVSQLYQIYVGPNELNEFGKLGRWAEETLDYGIFGGITKFLLWALATFYHLVKSRGLSIILLTFFISLLFLPLTGLSYNSMKRMKLIQPEVNKLRELYKDKPQKLNKEMMDLYKKHKVNPLGGCLPMVIQMPLFIAFYQALARSIELKGAPFLFIKDLSLPDHAIPLPAQLGFFGSAVNILPILMMIAMFIQQKMTSKLAAPASETEAQQQQMMAFMPLVFGFIFYGLPSGLVLYWLTNNLITIATQHFIFKRVA